MGRMGEANFNAFFDFTNRLQQFNRPELVKDFQEQCIKELAARLLSQVIDMTPVGDYPQSSGKVGGTLRKGWTSGTKQGAGAYVNSLDIQQSGSTVTVEIVNPVEYAPYVEYGHRTRDHQGWVEGVFMLTIAMDDLKKATPQILEKKLRELLEGVFR